MIAQNIEKITTLTNSLTNELSIILSWSTELEQLDKQYNDKLQKLHDVEARVDAKLHENKQSVISLANDKKELEELHKSISNRQTLVDKQTELYSDKAKEIDQRESILIEREKVLSERDTTITERESKLNNLKSILEKEQEGVREFKAKLEYQEGQLKKKSDRIMNIIK